MIEHHRAPLALAILLALVCLQPPREAVAQQSEVMRDVYGFHGSSLDVDVATESPGRIRLVRGGHSRIEVSGLALNGFASAALGGRGVRRLTLTSLGADRVDFIVVVPEDVRVRVHWPGARRSELFGTLSEAATYQWDTPAGRPSIEIIRPGSGSHPHRNDRDSAPTRSLGGSTPGTLDIIDAYRIDRLTVRIEDAPFGIAADRRFDARRDGDRLGITAPAGGDFTVIVPRGERFVLSLDGNTAIEVRGYDVRVLCSSVLSQELPGGRHWLTLTPSSSGTCTERDPADARADPPDRRT